MSINTRLISIKWNIRVSFISISCSFSYMCIDILSYPGNHKRDHLLLSSFSFYIDFLLCIIYIFLFSNPWPLLILGYWNKSMTHRFVVIIVSLAIFFNNGHYIITFCVNIIYIFMSNFGQNFVWFWAERIMCNRGRHNTQFVIIRA